MRAASRRYYTRHSSSSDSSFSCAWCSLESIFKRLYPHTIIYLALLRGSRSLLVIVAWTCDLYASGRKLTSGPIKSLLACDSTSFGDTMLICLHWSHHITIRQHLPWSCTESRAAQSFIVLARWSLYIDTLNLVVWRDCVVSAISSHTQLYAPLTSWAFIFSSLVVIIELYHPTFHRLSFLIDGNWYK